MFAITFDLGSGNLVLDATSNDDVASVAFVDAETIRASLNGETQDYALADVSRVTFFGKAGVDVFENSTSVAATAYGGFGNDTLIGGSAGDFLVGDGGDDTIYGGDGNDTLIGQAGVDTIYGGLGNDAIYGKGGNDRLFGEEGNDFVIGEEDDDELFGGLGDDLLSGHAGVDTLYGGDGNDTAYGGDDGDFLYGEAGNDTLLGLSGNDTLFGGDGDDHVGGGNDNDVVEGNAGADVVSGNHGSDIVRGGAGDDSVFGGSHDDQLFGGDGDDLLAGSSGNDVAFGGAGEDLIVGDGGEDELHGGDDADFIFGGEGDDVITGGAGADDLRGLGGNDILNGGDGDDDLYGGDGNDRLYGEAGLDVLLGDAGDDGLFGGIGSGDRLRGGEGSDRFLIWDGDVMLDRTELEAQLVFRNETSEWTEAEIRVVDEGLHWLAERAETNLIIRDSLDTDPVLYTKWDDLGGAVGINALTTYYSSRDGFSYDREIRFLEWDESVDFWNDVMIDTTIHEVGHSWETPEEVNNVLEGVEGLWEDFLAASQWTDTNPRSSDFVRSHDGQWWYHKDAAFAYDYGRTNPFEDWSTLFEAAYAESQGENVSAAIQGKLDLIDRLFEAFQQA